MKLLAESYLNVIFQDTSSGGKFEPYCGARSVATGGGPFEYKYCINVKKKFYVEGLCKEVSLFARQIERITMLAYSPSRCQGPS